MPALSPTMTQGNLGTWHKAVGDELTAGDVLVEVETDKAQVDFEFQDEGYLAKILLETGAKDVPVGQPIGVFVPESSSIEAFKDYTVQEPTGDTSAAAADPAPVQSNEPVSERAPSPSPQSTPEQSSGPAVSRILASPLAKTIALENGVPLKAVKGSGPNGRILAKDVENYNPPAPVPVVGSPQSSTPSPSQPSTYTDIEITNMRKTIASRLVQSKSINAEFFLSSTVSIGKLQKLRASLNAAADGAYKISVNDILIKALAVANLKVPSVNSAWLEGVIRQYSNVDVSVAVATPTGLITPVVRDVQAKGLAQISTEAKTLVKKARDGKLLPEEFHGGTITISNMGMNNAVCSFTSIINPPQSAILAVGTVQRVPVEDPESESGIAFDDVVTVTGTFDHRVIDGAVAGEWIKALKQVIENPLELLL